MSAKRTADEDPPRRPCKDRRVAAEPPRWGFPFSPYHFRWNCPDTEWKSNDRVCDQCVCYVCNVTMTFCRTRSHRFAAPPAVAQWDENRGVARMVTADDDPRTGVDTGDAVLLTTLTIPGVTFQDAIVGFGVPSMMVRQYLAVPCVDAVWPMLKNMGVFDMARDNGATEVFRAIDDACTEAVANKVLVSKMQRPAGLPAWRAVTATFQVVAETVGRSQHRMGAARQQHTLICNLYMQHNTWHNHKLVRLFGVMDLRSTPMLETPRETEFPEMANRQPHPYQVAALARMEFIEEHGLTHALWTVPAAANRAAIFPLFNAASGSAFLIDPARLEAGTQSLPDGTCYGGLLTNDRGTGKTCIAAALIAKNTAPPGWLEQPHDAAAIMPAGLEVPNPAAAAAADPDPEPRLSDEEEPAAAAAAAAPLVAKPLSDFERLIRNHHAQRCQRVRATLVVVPKPNLIPQWEEELAAFGLAVVRHHGAKKVKTVEALENCDVVLTTSGSLANAVYSDLSVIDSPLSRVCFWRLVVDECHNIVGGKTTQMAKALTVIRARNRWGITATPTRTLSAIRATAQFLYGIPTDEQARRSFVYDFVRHPGRHGMCSGIDIQRGLTVREDTDDVLPRVELHQHRISAPEAWRAAHDRVMDRCREVTRHRKLTNGAMQLLNGVLMAVGGARAMPMPTPESFGALVSIEDGEGGRLELLPPDVVDCAICLSDLAEPVRTVCRHFFCRGCINDWMEVQRGVNHRQPCPLCRRALAGTAMTRCTPAIAEAPAAAAAAAADVLPPLAMRVEAVASLLADLASRDNGGNAAAAERPANRILCFSRFPAVRQRLREILAESVRHTESVTEFQNDDAVGILLLSPKSCGVGLNLMQANHVVLVEPSFRAATEDQAYARAARMGQTRTVHVHRFVVDGTIEERVVQQQSRPSTSIRDIFV